MALFAAVFDDVKFGLRMLARNPGFTAVALMALALGIGVNSTVFTIVNGILFKSLPFHDANRVLYLATRDVSRGNRGQNGVSIPDFRDWREQSKSFEELCAFNGYGANYSDRIGLPELYFGARITANSFHAMGIRAAAGRDFNEADDKAGSAVVLLSYGLWERRYAKDPAVIGRSVRLNDVPTTVIGVMPQGFSFPFNGTDLWVPMTPTPEFEKREARNMIGFGRVKKGISLTTARTEIEGIAKRLQVGYPDTNQSVVALVQNYNDLSWGPDIQIMLAALMGAVGFVLLIACANIANMLLARAVARSREISIRAALGASRWRVIRQLLVESVMLSMTGGVLGWLLSIWGVAVFDRAAASGNGRPLNIDFSMDAHVLAFLIAISIGAGILFGLVPALRLSRLDVNSALKDGSRGASTGGRGKYLSGLLVVSETALAVVLLAGAGLMIRSFVNLYHTSTGVKVENVLTMRLALPATKYPKGDNQIDFHQRLKERLERLAGVDSVAIASNLPTGGGPTFSYEVEGSGPVDEKRRPTVTALVIGPDYFRVMSVPVLRGRGFTEADAGTGAPVVMVNQRFAETHWRGDDPIGRRLRVFNGRAPDSWMTVVGMVPNILQNDISVKQIDPLIYIPYRQKPRQDMAVVARTRIPPNSLSTAFRKEVQTMDQDLPVYNLWSMEDRLVRNYWPWRIFAMLFGIFAAIALLLASIGLYAVIAHSVSQRTQEIGVRMALGATARNVSGLVFTQGMRQTITGLGVGLAAAFAMTRVLRTMLIQVSSWDPATYTGIVVVLGLAAMMGCWIPAQRAMSIDPARALRSE
jgi:predicted permease